MVELQPSKLDVAGPSPATRSKLEENMEGKLTCPWCGGEHIKYYYRNDGTVEQEKCLSCDEDGKMWWIDLLMHPFGIIDYPWGYVECSAVRTLEPKFYRIIMKKEERRIVEEKESNELKFCSRPALKEKECQIKEDISGIDKERSGDLTIEKHGP